jgi:hypothetical protein
MTRFGSIILCATLGLAGAALTACGSNGSSGGKTLLDVFPRSGQISGWNVDPASAKTKDIVAATGADEATVEGLIDGASADFFKSPSTPVEFGVQNYISTTVADAPVDGTGVKVKLYILQMPTAAQASVLYASLMSANLYSTWNNSGGDAEGVWADPSSPVVGDHSRVVDAGDTWWVNFYKGVYYAEVWLNPSYGPKPDLVLHDQKLKAAAFAFAKAVADKM